MNDQLLNLSGKVALVTGAGQGVGRQIALHFANHGASAVGVNDVDPARAAAVAEEVSACGCQALPLVADVSDAAAVRDMTNELLGRFARVDCLVNNAGNMGARPEQVSRAPFWEAPRETWDAFLGVNLFGVMHCTSAVVPAMIEQRRGRLITIISDAGRVGEPGLEVYSAAKAGAAGFMRAVARGVGRHGITANCVAIATTRTPGVRDVTENEELAQRMLRGYVLRRFGEPVDVANMVLFLASDASSWITGQTYPVNGGFSFNL